LLFPIDWPEPFGLVMIEALACGTPVITRRCGSAPEVVQDGVTGFVCETDDEMVAAVRKVARLKRATCRGAFVERFSVQRMTQDYVAVYEACLAQLGLQRTSTPRRVLTTLPAHGQRTRPELSTPEGEGLLAVADPVLQSLAADSLSSAVIARSEQ
jgi:hypothetical protein